MSKVGHKLTLADVFLQTAAVPAERLHSFACPVILIFVLVVFVAPSQEGFPPEPSNSHEKRRRVVGVIRFPSVYMDTSANLDRNSERGL